MVRREEGRKPRFLDLVAPIYNCQADLNRHESISYVLRVREAGVLLVLYPKRHSGNLNNMAVLTTPPLPTTRDLSPPKGLARPCPAWGKAIELPLSRHRISAEPSVRQVHQSPDHLERVQPGLVTHV